jgi:hypothetical protein
MPQSIAEERGRDNGGWEGNVFGDERALRVCNTVVVTGVVRSAMRLR